MAASPLERRKSYSNRIDGAELRPAAATTPEAKRPIISPVACHLHKDMRKSARLQTPRHFGFAEDNHE